MGGKTFFDGQAVELNSEDDAHLIRKLENNPHFEFEIGEDDGKPKPKRGRPSNADKAAADAEKAAVIPGPKPGDAAPGTASV
jgi:hypothetical protein